MTGIPASEKEHKMKKVFFLFAPVLAAALTAAPVPDAGARKVLRKYAEAGKNYSARSGRTAFFSRAQLKYGLERSDYINRWTDYPLLQDTALAREGDGSFINPAGWKLMVKTVKDYGIDGFAFFPSTKGRADLFDKAVTPGCSLPILPELILGVGLDKISPLIEKALANRSVYRIGGKIVLTSYPATGDAAFWVKLKKDLTAKYGDKFLLMPMHGAPLRLIKSGGSKLTAEQVEELADIIRKWLRCCDGYYYNTIPLNGFRRYDGAFDRDVMTPLLHGILSEPEFRNKYLVWGTKVGHENYYVKGAYTHNCGGTSMLRGSVAAAVAARADIVMLIEWDEENENTSFRPTVANSFSTRRILRYFVGLARGKLLPPLAGDDVTVPDVILSYRRSLAAGETLTCEVVNVPEKGGPAGELPVRLILRDMAGRAVRTFEGKLDRSKLDELRFDVKVSDVLDSHVLIPELVAAGKTWKGFTPVELRANCNADNKWVKQPLRDLASCTAELKIDGILPDGRVKISGKVASPALLHHVTLYDSGSWAYMANTPEAFHETPDRVVVKIFFGTKPKAGISLTGSIRIRNAKDLSCAEFGKPDKRVAVTRRDGWDFPGGLYPNWFNTRQLVCSMDRASAEKAVFEISCAVKGPKVSATVFEGKIPVSEILSKNIYAVSGKGMSVLLLHHNDQPLCLPEGVKKKEVQFTVIRRPSLPQSVFFIETLDVNGKTFRSSPVSIYRPSGKKATFSAADFFDKKPVQVTCDENLLTVHKMEISPRFGSVVGNSAGNEFTGLGGNLSALANNLRMASDTNQYSSLVVARQRTMADDLDSAPQTVPASGGGYAWRFDGGQNVSFPVAMLYPFSGFELTMDVTPRDTKKNQTLFSSGHAGFTLSLCKGVPTAVLYRGNAAPRSEVRAAGPRLAAGKKSRIVVRFDQKTMRIVVDGKAGKAVPCFGYQLYPAAVSVGMGVRDDGFRGDISLLEIKPL